MTAPTPQNPSQRIANLIRIGVVAEVDYTRARARVRVGGNLTDWLRWRTERCGLVKTWNPPTVGEEVEVIGLEGNTESAYIGGSFYSSANPAPSQSGVVTVVLYSDGTRVEHNRSSGTTTVTGLKTLSETIEKIQTVADITHTGDTSATGKLTQNGDTSFAANVAVAGELKNKGTNVGKSHTHQQNNGNDNGGGVSTGGAQ